MCAVRCTKQRELGHGCSKTEVYPGLGMRWLRAYRVAAALSGHLPGPANGAGAEGRLRAAGGGIRAHARACAAAGPYIAPARSVGGRLQGGAKAGTSAG